MNPAIRQASYGDLETIQYIVDAAYEHYTARIGRPPSPLTDDYATHVASGNVWVLLVDGEIIGVVVLLNGPDHLLLDNVAVVPEKQRQGFGRLLIGFAEEVARQRGYGEIQLYTNELMNENLALYNKLGYQEFSRRVESGFRRVFLRKQI
jgi:ribosomal protein S18 acetylase RimI-like enzyme